MTKTAIERGYKVVAFDISESELEHTARVSLKKYSDANTLHAIVCKLRGTDDIREKVKQAAELLDGRIDVLVNDGGIATPKWSNDQTMESPATLEEWQAYVETNLTAPFALSQACIPCMKTRAAEVSVEHHDDSDPGPCIIHIGSFRAHQSDPNQEGYAATRAGQLGLMHSMAIGLQQFGIRVNLVAPGRIKVAHESKDGDERGLEWAEQNEEKDVADRPTDRAGRPRQAGGHR